MKGERGTIKRVVSRRWIAASIAVLALFSTACASSYKPVGLGGGYSETQLSENAFTISFRGNGYTSWERATDFALLREAEVTLDNHYRYFITVDSAKEAKQFVVSTPSQSSTTSSASVVGQSFGPTFVGTAQGQSITTTHPGNSFLVTKPRVSNTIVCFVERPQVAVLVYDAEFLSGSIRSKYGMIGK